jgi:hypothetical protein
MNPSPTILRKAIASPKKIPKKMPNANPRRTFADRLKLKTFLNSVVISPPGVFYEKKRDSI